MHAAGFVRSPYIVEKGEKVSKGCTSYYSIETRELLERVGLFFNMVKVLLKCSYFTLLTFFKIISYDIVSDRFETDSVNVMKKGRLLQRNKGNFSIY